MPRYPDAVKYPFDVAFICHQRLLSHNTEPNPVATLLYFNQIKMNPVERRLSADPRPLVLGRGMIALRLSPAGETPDASQPQGRDVMTLPSVPDVHPLSPRHQDARRPLLTSGYSAQVRQAPLQVMGALGGTETPPSGTQSPKRWGDGQVSGLQEKWAASGLGIQESLLKSGGGTEAYPDIGTP